MKKKVSPISLAANTTVAGAVTYDLRNIIDRNFEDNNSSPIDDYFINANEINILLTDTNPSRVLGNLIILGYVSAVESYFRAIFRRLIIVDSISRESCEKKQIQYGAAITHEGFMLPEALFENASLASKKNIMNTIRDSIGFSSLNENIMPIELVDSLNKFDEICEIRHCIVHRFGKFGSSNAINLGLTKYGAYIEKPIRCSYSSLQDIILICQNVVRIMNNFLFEKTMNRLIISGKEKISDTPWQWDYNSDKKLFNDYFQIFYSTIHPPTPSLTMRKAYNAYKKHYIALP